MFSWAAKDQISLHRVGFFLIKLLKVKWEGNQRGYCQQKLLEMAMEMSGRFVK